LAQALENSWSVFGIISEKELGPEWNDQSSGQLTIEEMARDYIQSIMLQQSSGPYSVLGYSFAGILAFEVARQLTAAGHQVEKLILVDAMLPEWVFRWQYRFKQLMRALRTKPSDLLGYLFRKTRKRRSKTESKFGHIEKERGHRNSLIAEDYMKRMPSYSGEALLFVARERLKKRPLHSRSCGWIPYIAQLKVVMVDADHYSMIEDPGSLQRMVKEINANQVNGSAGGFTY
jgi:thioesterase domain-containing protein